MNKDFYRGTDSVTYGESPKIVKENVDIDGHEMMYYLYYPVKLMGSSPYWVTVEDRLKPFTGLILDCMQDFVDRRLNGDDYDLSKYNVYISVSRLFVPAGKAPNRPCWHSDGFMSDDVSYIWYDSHPTIFNTSHFELTQDHKISMDEMNEQALPENNETYPCKTILFMDQSVIHKVNEGITEDGVRTFVKVTISKDKFDLEGNTHNYELPYSWNMRKRSTGRNQPQNQNEDIDEVDEYEIQELLDGINLEDNEDNEDSGNGKG